jgi:hypothetical protein
VRHRLFNGQWAMGNGQWATGNGHWAIRSPAVLHPRARAVTLGAKQPPMPFHVLLDSAAAAGDDPMKWAPALVGGGILLYFLMRNAARRKRKPDPMDRQANGGGMSLAHQRNTEREMQHLLVELSQMARQLTAQLDTRSAKLELLIREADEKLAQLKSATDLLAPADHDRFRIPLPPAGEREPPNVVFPDAARAKHAEVYALQDAGRTPLQIAEQLGRPTGEIELILALRPRD